MKLKSMMKRFANLLAVFILSVNCISAQNLTRWVNPFIGTGAVQSSLSGNNYPGATVPFGMVQLSPYTREAPDWAQASGYDYNLWFQSFTFKRNRCFRFYRYPSISYHE